MERHGKNKRKVFDKMRKFWVVAALLAFAFTLSPVTSFAQSAANVERGATAPGFTLKDLAGKSVSLAQYRGKIVVLNFWASWCPPCREEFPSLERLNEVFAGKDFVMLGVNADTDKANLEDFLGKHLHTFTILPDPDAKVQDLYGVDKFPETFIIGRDGKILEHVIGAIDWSSVKVLSYFNNLIGG
jgi:peroxiredoxin